MRFKNGRLRICVHIIRICEKFVETLAFTKAVRSDRLTGVNFQLSLKLLHVLICRWIRREQSKSNVFHAKSFFAYTINKVIRKKCFCFSENLQYFAFSPDKCTVLTHCIILGVIKWSVNNSFVYICVKRLSLPYIMIKKTFPEHMWLYMLQPGK